jgi:hypothetical protein
LDGQRKDDPTANPITRRPGPGRGRPRKLPPVPVTDARQMDNPKRTNPPPETQVSDPSPSIGSVKTPTSAPEPSSAPVEEPGTDLQEQPSKRQRLEDNPNASSNLDSNASTEEGVQQVSSDEAVLALAADGIASAVDDYPPE